MASEKLLEEIIEIVKESDDFHTLMEVQYKLIKEGRKDLVELLDLDEEVDERWTAMEEYYREMR